MRKWGFGALLGIGWVTALWACVHDLGPTSRAETKSIEATLRPDAILDASRVPGAPNAFWAGPWASGAWFSPQRSGEGVVLEYLEDGRALAIWFTYPPVGAAGSQAWLLASEGHVDGAVLRFDAVLRPTGARFGDAFDPAQVSYEAWGTLEIEFADCDQATLRWQGPEGWGSGSYPVQRLSRLKEIDCGGQRALGAAGARSLAGLDSRSGAWYQPQRSGEGWLLEELDDEQALVFWFTFDPDGEQAWLIGQGPLRDGAFEVTDALIGGGARFGAAFDAGDVVLRSWGTLRIEFSDCDQAQLSYASTLDRFGSAQRPVRRLTTLAGSPCRSITEVPAGSPRWVERQRMTPPFQSELAATAAQGKLYATGGFGNPRAFRVYDASSDHWSELPELPGGRDHLTAFAIGDAIYASGGAALGGGDQQFSAQRFLLAEQQWEPVPEIGFHFGTHAAVLHGRAYIALNDGRLQEFDPRQQAVRLIGRLAPLERDHSQLVAFQDELWLIGGRAPETKRVAIYDPVSETWREGPPLNRFRGGFAAAANDRHIMVAGGEVIDLGLYIEPSSEAIGIGEQSWALGPDLPVPVHGTDGAELEGRLFVVSGSNRAGSAQGAQGRLFEWLPE